MKRLILFLLIAASLTACMDSENVLSAIDYARMGENQMRHYHPVHPLHPDWSIAESGKIAILRADQRSLKLSVRRPDQVVVRAGGKIIGHVRKTTNGVTFEPLDPATASLDMTCAIAGIVDVHDKNQTVQYRIEETQVSTATLRVRAISPHHYSMTTCQGCDAECTGSSIETPMSTLGTAILNTDALPLEPRAGLAWFVSKIAVCDLSR